MSGGRIVISRRGQDDGIRMAGHGWGGKTRKKKIQGRVVALEDSKRKTKGSNPGRRQQAKTKNSREITDV